jgi:hypothetical protein
MQSMVSTSSNPVLPKREVFYQRQRTKNHFFAQISSFFAEEAERDGVTKRELARRLSCDPAQMTRWLTTPSNMTVEGISDVLLSMDAEAELHIAKFSNMAQPNFEHPLITAAKATTKNNSGAISGTSAPTAQTSYAVVDGGTVHNVVVEVNLAGPLQALSTTTAGVTPFSFGVSNNGVTANYYSGAVTWQTSGNQINSQSPTNSSSFLVSETHNTGTYTLIHTS